MLLYNAIFISFSLFSELFCPYLIHECQLWLVLTTHEGSIQYCVLEDINYHFEAPFARVVLKKCLPRGSTALTFSLLPIVCRAFLSRGKSFGKVSGVLQKALLSKRCTPLSG